MSSGVARGKQHPQVDQYKELEALRTPGEENPRIEMYVSQALKDYDDVDIPAEGGCPLDIVDFEELAATEHSDGEQVFYVDENSFVCSAEPGPGKPEKGWENGLKGHSVRNIGVYREYGVIPSPDELGTTFGDYNMADVLREIATRQIKEGYLALYGSMASEEERFHLVASDLKVEEDAEIDLVDVNSYFLYEVEDGSTEFLEGRVCDSFGRYIQELLEEDEDLIDFTKA